MACQGQIQRKKVVQASLKAPGNIVGRDVVPTQFDAQRNALCGQLCAGQGHGIDMHLEICTW